MARTLAQTGVRDAGLTFRCLRGAELAAHILEVARLRIEVFREFPYLYDGDLDYERRYLQTYLESPDSIVVLALDGAQVVGASTALPMACETAEFRQPFVAAGYDPVEVFYCGESVLLSRYRGRGAGVAFFDRREAHARSLGGFRYICFSAVQRPDDHPRRPPGYVPLDDFWQRRGYRRQPKLTTRYSWKDLDETASSPKPMVFWMKELGSGSRGED